MITYRVGNHHGVTIVAEGERCCELHNEHCELPSELCCARCTEATHDGYPAHSNGVQCAMTGKSGQLVAVVVDGGTALAERICKLLNTTPCRCSRTHCPRCGAHVELHARWGVCGPCAVAEGWETADA